ncbi:dihydrolipoyl dehydrogenase [Sphingomonas sp.]|uniref:dihydrolipoyl dehydrogenase n=1 Tax=Sphingomonas sp. TaxID=28214 RepID=UPI003AFF7CF5
MPDLTCRDLQCDVAIIGAGTAGLAAERSARKAGAATLLIDPAFNGTTCARVGCMPSKLLIAAGEAAHAVREAGRFGVRVPAPDIDGAAVMARVRALRDDFVRATVEGLDDLPDGIMVKARARFTGLTTLALDDGRTVAAKAVVIATGATPSIPPAYDAVRDRVLTHETVFELADLPRSLAVVGAGPLGLELAQAMARLGVDVTVFDEGSSVGGIKDEAVAAEMRRILGAEFAWRLDTELEASPAENGVRLAWRGEQAGEAVFEQVLVAAGRPPALEGLDLGTAGLELDDHGTPIFDRATMRCGGSAVFVAGDADADRPVLHEASSEGAIAGRNAALHPDTSPARRTVPFAIMFTDPSVAIVGDAVAEGAIVGTSSYADQGRARMMGTNRGLARLLADPAEGRIVGATIAAPGGEHLGHLLAWAIEQGLTATKLLDLPIYHPTYEEGLKTALREICAGTGTEPPADRDEGNPAGG